MIAGEHAARPYDGDEFDDLGTATGESAHAILRSQIIERSHRVVAERSLDAEGKHPGTGEQHSLRWVLNHMIEDTAATTVMQI